MAKKAGAQVEGDAVTLATEGLEDPDAPVFPDSRGAEPAEEVRLVEEEPEKAPKSPGTRADKARGDGEAVTGKEPDAEKENLRKALRQERGKRRTLLDDIRYEKEQRQRAEERAKATEEQAARAKKLEALDEAEDLKSAAPILSAMTKDSIMPEINGLHRKVIRQSQELARLRHQEEYDRRLEESGLVDFIRVDPQTGKPKDLDMWKAIYVDADDPGEAAYEIATSLLEEAGKLEREEQEEGVEVLNERAGDRATGRREVIDRLNKTAERPKGIRDLPSAGAPISRKLTRRQMDLMTDEQRAKLPPDVIEEWLAGAPT